MVNDALESWGRSFSSKFRFVGQLIACDRPEGTGQTLRRLSTKTHVEGDLPNAVGTTAVARANGEGLVSPSPSVADRGR
jgi:hypothetical protein